MSNLNFSLMPKRKNYSVRLKKHDCVIVEYYCSSTKAHEIFMFYLSSFANGDLYFTNLALCVGDCVIHEYNNYAVTRQVHTVNF